MNFKELRPEDEKLLEQFFNKYKNNISEYNFNLLQLWKFVYQPSYAIENDILYITQRYKRHEYALMPICDKSRYGEAFERIVNYIKGKEETFTMYCVNEDFAQYIEENHGDDYEILKSRDEADYIYDADQLRTLKGTKFHKKRNHVNRFIKDYDGRWDYKELTSKDLPDCCKLLMEWKEQKSQESYEQIQGEILGIRDILDNIEDMSAKAAGIYVDGKLEAFTIGSYHWLNHEMGVIHVEKANTSMRGLYPLINQQFLIHGLKDATYVNREEDMGSEGMRQAKMAYRPIDFAWKYSIYEKVK